MNVIDILNRMREVLGAKNDSELLKMLNLNSKGAISTWKKRNKIPLKECFEISQKKGVSLDWLIYGNEDTQTNAEVVQIPEFKEVVLSAGGGVYPPDHMLAVKSRSFSRRDLRDKGLRPEKLSLIRVHGDSMEPTLKDRDLVMIDQSRTRHTDGMPYAVFFDGGLYVKLIQPLGQGVLRLVSINKFYDPIEVNLDKLSEGEFKIVGAVVWHSHSWV